MSAVPEVLPFEDNVVIIRLDMCGFLQEFRIVAFIFIILYEVC